MIQGSSAISACSCVSSYQDARYGRGMRVHTVGNPGRIPSQLSCTVCKPSRAVLRLETHGALHNKLVHG